MKIFRNIIFNKSHMDFEFEFYFPFGLLLQYIKCFKTKFRLSIIHFVFIDFAVFFFHSFLFYSLVDLFCNKFNLWFLTGRNFSLMLDYDFLHISLYSIYMHVSVCALVCVCLCGWVFGCMGV